MKRKITAAFLLVAMIVSGLVIKPTTADAAEEGYADKVVFEDKTSDFKTMWKENGTGSSPMKEGYVFCGWYVDGENGKQALTAEEAKVKVSDNSLSQAFRLLPF